MLSFEEKRAVIMAGADVESYLFFEHRSTDYLICADRGYLHAKNLNLTPDVLLGDFDSVEGELPSDISCIKYPAEKDETDLQIAIRYALSLGFHEIYVLGAYGGRMDHFLGNVSLLKWTSDKGGNLILEDRRHAMFLLHDEAELSFQDNTYLSIIPLFGDAVVSLSGVKYPTNKTRFKAGDTLGISNEFSAEKATIQVHSGSVIVMLARKE